MTTIICVDSIDPRTNEILSLTREKSSVACNTSSFSFFFFFTRSVSQSVHFSLVALGLTRSIWHSRVFGYVSANMDHRISGFPKNHCNCISGVTERDYGAIRKVFDSRTNESSDKNFFLVGFRVGVPEEVIIEVLGVCRLVAEVMRGLWIGASSRSASSR